jgi:hypothetical protein
LAQVFKTTAIRHPSALEITRFRAVPRSSAPRVARCHRTCHRRRARLGRAEDLSSLFQPIKGLLIDIGLDHHMSNVTADGQPHGHHRVDNEAEIGLPAFELEPECVLRALLDFRAE